MDLKTGIWTLRLGFEGGGMEEEEEKEEEEDSRAKEVREAKKEKWISWSRR